MSILALVSIVVTAAAIFGWLSARVCKLPITIGTMLLTVVSSTAMIALARVFPGLHTWAVRLVGSVRFEDLILHGMLGLLLFAGSFLLDLESVAREKLAIGLLSVVGTLLSTVGVVLLMHWGLPFFGLPASWLECMFFGTLISPTDPVAVLELLHRARVGKNIQAQLAGESLFNDGVGAVLFLAVLEASRGHAPSVAHIAGLLLIQAGGGLALGVCLAWIASELMRRVDAYQIEILLTLALAAGGYALGESLHLSAPLEAVAAGLALRRLNMNHTELQISHESLNRFWTVIDEVQNSILFVLLGFEVLVIPFGRQSFLAGGAAAVGVTVVRIAVVASVLLVVRVLQPGHTSSWITLSWAGLRGGLSIALALSVPDAQGRPWVLSATYLVVVFSIVVQGGTLDLVTQLRAPERKLPQE